MAKGDGLRKEGRRETLKKRYRKPTVDDFGTADA